MKRFTIRLLLISIVLVGLEMATGCGGMSAGYYSHGYGHNYGYGYGYDPYYYDGTMPPGERYGNFYGYPY